MVQEQAIRLQGSHGVLLGIEAIVKGLSTRRHRPGQRLQPRPMGCVFAPPVVFP